MVGFEGIMYREEAASNFMTVEAFQRLNAVQFLCTAAGGVRPGGRGAR